MEEKKVCPECENKEHKLEELTQEEAQQVAGGVSPTIITIFCPNCKAKNMDYPAPKKCEVCGVSFTGRG